MRLQRIFDRANRVSAGLKENPHPKVLDAFNDTLHEVYLHPRKGYRKITTKRSRAMHITAEQKAGNIPPTILVLKQIGAIIRGEKPL